MNILIFGASGATGQHLVKQALLLGHTVTAFVRNAAKLGISHQHLKIVTGNVVDYHSIDIIMKDQDAVISALGAPNPFRYDQAVVNGVKNIIRAMENNGVQRFIYLSFTGVKESRNRAGFVIRYIAPLLLSTEIKGHEAREKLIRESKLRWTIVRAPTLTNSKPRAQYRSGENIISKGFVVSISRTDVASFMLGQVTGKTFLSKAALVMY